MGPLSRFTVIKRNTFSLILTLAVILIFALETFNYYHYRSAVKEEIFSDLEVIINKLRNSIELYLREKVATIKFIASVYTCEDLLQPGLLKKIYDIIQKEYGGGVLGIELVGSEGNQISSAGLFSDIGRRNYRDWDWFREIQTKGTYVGEIFDEDYGYSYLIVSVIQRGELGKWSVFTMGLDINRLVEILNSTGSNLETFLVDSRGICKTNSQTLCKINQPCLIGSLPLSYNTITMMVQDYYISYVYLAHLHYALVVARKKDEVFIAWRFFREKLFFVFLINLLIIAAVAYRKHVKKSYEKRGLTLSEMRYSDKLTSISRLASGVAHEINNPLSIISENAGLMKDLLLSGESFPEGKRFVRLIDSILEAVDRCRKITHNLLEFAGDIDINMEILDLNGVVKEVLKNLEDEATRRNISIVPNLAKDLPSIYSDKKHLQQVFLNILTNASEAIDDGGKVYVTTWESDNNTVAVTIRDTGKGMPEEVMAQIFEPFFSAKKTYSTGLGLAVTYGIVKRLGGDIKVESREGEGTAFTVFLPKKMDVHDDKRGI